MKTTSKAVDWWLGLGIMVVASAWFSVGVGSEPSFVDEWAYISQAYFADLYIGGLRDDPAWLEYPGYDLPPLPKYLIGGSLRLAGLPRPPQEMMVRWYGDTSTRTGTEAMLRAGRWPSVLLGGLGCAMIYAIGLQLSSRGLGVIAAVLLVMNPLYRLHAHRAMSDVPAEALILLTLALGLWVWRRQCAATGWGIGLMVASAIVGVFGGLAVLAKLNGALALMTIGMWSLLNVTFRIARTSADIRMRRVITSGIVTPLLAGAVGFITFVLMNPFMTARPKGPLPPVIADIASQGLWGRAKIVASHRADVSNQAMKLFPHNALSTLPEKVAAVAVQGYGRFGPLGPSHTDSTKRFDLAQDWGALLWLPLTVAGFLLQLKNGRDQWRSRKPPIGLAIAGMTGLAVVVITGFIPLAWDRYYLSIQPGAALLVAGLLDAILGWFLRSPTTP